MVHHTLLFTAGGLQHLPGLRKLEYHAIESPELDTGALESLDFGGCNGDLAASWPKLGASTTLAALCLRDMPAQGMPW